MPAFAQRRKRNLERAARRPKQMRGVIDDQIRWPGRELGGEDRAHPRGIVLRNAPVRNNAAAQPVRVQCGLETRRRRTDVDANQPLKIQQLREEQRAAAFEDAEFQHAAWRQLRQQPEIGIQESAVLAEKHFLRRGLRAGCAKPKPNAADIEAVIRKEADNRHFSTFAAMAPTLPTTRPGCNL